MLKWTVRIETTLFAGDFYRQLCAHLTGVVGDNDDGSAERFVDEEVKEVFEGSLVIEPRDKGWLSAASYEPRAIEIHFKEKPTEKQINIIRDRLRTFAKAYREKDENAEYLDDTSLEFPSSAVWSLQTIRRYEEKI